VAGATSADGVAPVAENSMANRISDGLREPTSQLVPPPASPGWRVPRAKGPPGLNACVIRSAPTTLGGKAALVRAQSSKKTVASPPHSRRPRRPGGAADAAGAPRRPRRLPGATIDAVGLIVAGRHFECNFASRVATGHTNALFDLMSLIERALPILWPLTDSRDIAEIRKLRQTLASVVQQPNLFNDIDSSPL
jgi:hypothetical protein